METGRDKEGQGQKEGRSQADDDTNADRNSIEAAVNRRAVIVRDLDGRDHMAWLYPQSGIIELIGSRRSLVALASELIRECDEDHERMRPDGAIDLSRGRGRSEN